MLMETHVLASEQPASEWRVRDDGDAKFARGAQDVRRGALDVEREERVLDLDGRDGVHGVRAADRRRRALRQAEVAHLACPTRSRRQRGV